MRRALRVCFGPRVWARLLYGLLGCPTGVAGLVYLVLVLAAAIPLAPLAPWLPLARTGYGWLLRGVLGFGTLHRWLARVTLDVRVEPPENNRPALTNLAVWRTTLYLLVKLPMAYGEFWAVAGPAFAAGSLMAFPLWWGAMPALWEENYPPTSEHPSIPFCGIDVGRWPGSLLVVAAGILLVPPALALGRVALLDALAVRYLLGPSDLEKLRARRATVVDTSAAQLRRIERDLHDGAQAQLAALAMRLGMAKEELAAGEVDAAFALVDAAHAGAKQALVELRDLARGIHPSSLDDGLDAALETLASRSAIPIDLWVTLRRRPSPAIEAIAYFTAAELLANAAKHSGAGHIVLVVEPLGAKRLRMVVCDDGVGGAQPDGSGLTGLAQRVGAVDGRLTVDSPSGGPTTVLVELPERA